MPVREILKYGNTQLLERSQDVLQFDTEELHQLIVDMQETMAFHDGAGLAAPQIGVMQRVVIFGSNEVRENPRYPNAEHVPYTILINPIIEILADSVDGMWEGCLSIPGMRGFVERPNLIRYQGFDQFGNEIEREVSGFHAIVVQHECDHLDGVLYPMRIQDLRKFGLIDHLDIDVLSDLPN